MHEPLTVSTATPVGKAYRGASNDIEVLTLGGRAAAALFEAV